MKDFWDSILSFSQTTVKTVGQQFLKDFGSAQANEKDDGTLVTQSDNWADATIRSAIASTFPSHGILSEEGEHVFPDTEWCWVVDPLDATTNFARGIPIWGISLGLLYRGTPVFGCVHLPPLNQTFHGFFAGDFLEKNVLTDIPQGAFLNGKLIRPTADKMSGNHIFNLCSRSVGIGPHLPSKIRMLGMASYNFLTVASGVSMGGVEATPKIWDIAGSWVIVKAAGAVWLPLDSQAIFPLEVGKNYARISYPTLVMNRQELVSVFLPFVEAWKQKKLGN
ncbi:MAG: inositol monophosphatase family protein [Tychonema bourrellyi B0820]|uniref:Inositol monophosphatase n=1 Tax=Tychonema bourrellyi FEM_GT703 TaxID=2040638 RepID=A0A2G4F1R3_9CYAN|nr:inositol monophosphatase family protein [Tychonema bourrellyi]MDQ2098348.1 inositol monophosphatase family protein [Tychonema bourrellyi B0820]PHX55703.1 inositol monophosphatase [Tychonema bourrellyi FEM_GT703]